jgi:hypothetical protein
MRFTLRATAFLQNNLYLPLDELIRGARCQRTYG